MKAKLNIKSKICIFILSPISVFIISILLYVVIKDSREANNNACELLKQQTEQQSVQATIILSRNIGYLNSLASALSGESDTLSSLQHTMYGKILYNTATTSGQDMWVIWNSSFYADSNYLDNEWLMMLPSDNDTRLSNNIFNFKNRYSNCLQTSTTSISAPYEHENKWLVNITTPIYHSGEIRGFAGLTTECNIFSRLELCNSDNYKVAIINNELKNIYSNYNITPNNNFSFTGDTTDTQPIKQLLGNNETSTILKIDGEKTIVSASTIYIDGVKPWNLIIMYPQKTAISSAMRGIHLTIIIAIICWILICLIVYVMATTITRPIQGTNEALKHLALGDTENIEHLKAITNDELGDMATSLNQVVEGIRKSETFALNIGDGNFDSNFHALSDRDRLGDALIKMRENLIENKKQEAARKEEEELRNWATEGIAKFGEILRKDQNNMKSLGYNVMSNLIDYLKVNQGALFVINDDDENDIYFSMVTAIAYGRDKYMKKDIRIGEGLIGRCVYERKTIYLTEVPDDYVKITSGLGTANPNCILIVPCALNDEIYGVIEIAAFTPLKPYEIDFVEKLGESIASTVASVKVTEKTSKLLQASQEQSDELTSQEEELRQNLEEMQATQEDLRRQMDENQQMRDELTKEKSMMDSLMTNANEVIYFKDINGRIIRASNSYLKRFGIASIDDALGKTDSEIYDDKKAAQEQHDIEQQIISTGQAVINHIQEVNQGGNSLLISKSIYPLYDNDGRIIGTFAISSADMSGEQ